MWMQVGRICTGMMRRLYWRLRGSLLLPAPAEPMRRVVAIRRKGHARLRLV